MEDKFLKELTELLNRHSKDNETNTPDFILAESICRHIFTISELNRTRDRWHGFESLDPAASEKGE